MPATVSVRLVLALPLGVAHHVEEGGEEVVLQAAHHILQHRPDLVPLLLLTAPAPLAVSRRWVVEVEAWQWCALCPPVLPPPPPLASALPRPLTTTRTSARLLRVWCGVGGPCVCGWWCVLEGLGVVMQPPGLAQHGRAAQLVLEPLQRYTIAT
jgi:hypothetical protein